jgi:hypothetical protein
LLFVLSEDLPHLVNHLWQFLQSWDSLLLPTLGAHRDRTHRWSKHVSQAFTMMNFQQFELSEIVKYKQN